MQAVAAEAALEKVPGAHTAQLAAAPDAAAEPAGQGAQLGPPGEK